MKKQINLLLSSKRDEKLEKVKTWLVRLMIVSLLIFSLASLFLIGVNAFVLRETEQLAEKADKNQLIIEEHRQVESLYTVILQKLDYLGKKLTGRFAYADTLTTILELIPGGVTLNGLSIDEQGAIDMTVVVDSPNQLKKLADNFLSHEKLASFEVILSGTNRNKDGSYDLSLRLRKQETKEAAVQKTYEAASEEKSF